MDHIPTTARASARTMDDLILPALIEAGNPRAHEQACLIRDLLLFVADRAHLVGARLDFQLCHAIGLSTAALAEAGDADMPVATALSATIDRAHLAVACYSVDPGERMDLVDQLFAGLSAVVTAVAEHGDAIDAARMQRLVIDGMRVRIEADRAWLAPMGFDPEPSTIGSLDTLLDIHDHSRLASAEAPQEER